MSKKTLVILLVVLLMLMLTGGVALVALFAGYTMATTGNVKVDNVKQEYIEQLDKAIVYTANSTKPQQYYAPLFDLVLTYDPTNFRVSESVFSIDVYEKGIADSVGSIKKAKTNDVYKEQSEYFKGFQNLVISSLKNDGAISYFTVKYDSENYVNKTELKHNVITYIAFSNGATKYYMEIRGVDIEKDAIAQTYLNVVKSISFDTSDINKTIKVALNNGAVLLSFDKSTWIKESNFEYSVSLTYATQDKYAVPQYFSMSSVSGYDSIKEANYLTDYVSKQKKYSLESDYRKITITKDIYDLSAGKNTFKCFDYTDENDKYDFFTTTTAQQDYLHTECYAIIGSEYVVGISFNYLNKEDASYKAFEKLLSDISASETPVSLITNKDSLGNVLGDSSLSINKAVIVGQPSTVHIFSRNCYKVKVDPIKDFTATSNKSYSGCLAGTGSGFYVTTDGYIITNSHVVGMNPVDDFFSLSIYGLLKDGNGKSIVYNILNDLYSQYGSDVMLLSKEQLLSATLEVLSTAYDQDFISIDTPTKDLYIENGKAFETDDGEDSTFDLLNKDECLKAELIDQNELDSQYLKGEDFKVNVADLALLKVSGSNYPAIKVETQNNTVVGSNIYVIGFPGVDDVSGFTSNNSSSISTATTGSISSIKQNATGDFNLLQIDASIDHGNSGGPILSSDAKVIAVATYGLSSNSGNYNFGVDSAQVVKMLSNNGVTNKPGELSVLLSSGMDAMEKHFFKKAVDYFTKAKTASSVDVDNLVTPLINISNEKITAGEDETPIFSMGEFPLPISSIVIICLMVIIFIVIIILLRILLKKPVTKAKPVAVVPTVVAPIATPVVNTTQVITEPVIPAPASFAEPVANPLPPVMPTPPQPPVVQS